MKTIISKSLLLILFIFISHVSVAQTSEPDRSFSVEVNPLAFAFSGWSIGGTYHPTTLNNWVFNAGAYGFEMPEMFVDQIPGNEDEGFELKIAQAFTIGADYYPWSENRSGFAFGLSTVLANFGVTNEEEPGQADYTSFYVVPRASYTWFVYEGFYLMPWVGVEFHTKVSGETQVGTLEFEPMTVQFSPNLSIGYTF